LNDAPPALRGIDQSRSILPIGRWSAPLVPASGAYRALIEAPDAEERY
jgi:hypothetical protein